MLRSTLYLKLILIDEMKIKMNRELFIYAAAAGIKGWGLISIFILEKPDLDGNLIKRENKTSSSGTKLVFLVFFLKYSRLNVRLNG
jgi:hypothetical protein